MSWKGIVVGTLVSALFSTCCFHPATPIGQLWSRSTAKRSQVKEMLPNMLIARLAGFTLLAAMMSRYVSGRNLSRWVVVEMAFELWLAHFLLTSVWKMTPASVNLQQIGVELSHDLIVCVIMAVATHSF